MCWKMSVLLVLVALSVTVCLLRVLRCQAAVCCFMLSEQQWCSQAGWLFCCFFMSLEFVSLLLPPCMGAGWQVRAWRLYCLQVHQGFFCCLVGWGSLCVCLLVSRLLKVYTKLWGEHGWKVSQIIFRRHHSDPSRGYTLIAIYKGSGWICAFRQHQHICSGCCGNNKGFHIFFVCFCTLKLDQNNMIHLNENAMAEGITREEIRVLCLITASAQSRRSWSAKLEIIYYWLNINWSNVYFTITITLSYSNISSLPFNYTQFINNDFPCNLEKKVDSAVTKMFVTADAFQIH